MEIIAQEIEEFIKGCINGDRKCQQEVYQRLYGKMMSVCLRYTKDSHEAKDILQDGFIKVFNNLSKYDFNGSFEGWVRRIIVNTAIDYYRKNKYVYSFSDSQSSNEDINPTNEDDFEESIYNNIKTEDIMAAIQQLSPAYRTVFNLYVMEGYSHQQISEALQISIGTSKSNFSKAKQNLQKILKNKILYE